MYQTHPTPRAQAYCALIEANASRIDPLEGAIRCSIAAGAYLAPAGPGVYSLISRSGTQLALLDEGEIPEEILA